MKYRREIDGLRAIAVLPVILFHAGFRSFSGGFTGVDVFFVISGYLITTIIYADLGAGRFSILDFYERRARRILPALFFVLFSCLPFAWFWLIPADMKSFCQSLVAVTTFASNILFWQTSGYFDGAAELKPLLHTWSLAVEEQYYLFFPLLLMVTSRLRVRWMISVLGALFVVSFAAAQSMSSDSSVAAFFLLPTRGWELIVGALVALYFSERSRDSFNSVVNECGSLIGLALIVYAVQTFDKQTPWPSIYTLVPTAGTALIILFATQQTLVGRLLGHTWFVGVGLISYSAYLWHQPLFAFARLRRGDEIGPQVIFGLLLATLVLAYLSWKYVEQPFRNRHRFDRRKIFLYSGYGSVFFIAVGTTGHVLAGVPQRFSPQQQQLLALGNLGMNAKLRAYGLGTCFLDYEQTVDVLVKNECVNMSDSVKRVVVFGDSEAAHWMPGIRQEFNRLGFRVGQWTGTSCRAVSFLGNTKRCDEMYRGFLGKVVPTLTKSDIIVVSSRWIGTLEQVGRKDFAHALHELFQQFVRSGAHVVVVGNTPEYPLPPQHIMVKYGIANTGTILLKSADFREVNQLLKEESQRFGFEFADPSLVLCDRNDELRCQVARDGTFLFFDGGHLSPAGSLLVMQKLVPRLQLANEVR